MKYLLFVFIMFTSVVYSQTAPPPPQTDCQLFPNALGCASVASPDPEPLPTITRDISMLPGGIFSSSSACPADVSMPFRGSTLVLIPMATACGLISTWFRPIVLLIAGLTAIFIVLPSDY